MASYVLEAQCLGQVDGDELSRLHDAPIELGISIEIIVSTGMFLKGMNGLGMNLTERNFPILTENYLVMWGW